MSTDDDDVPQGSEAWHESRKGRITASRFAEAMGSRQARMTYARELAFMRLSHRPIHSISSKSTKWGTEVEPFAVTAFEHATGLFCRTTPFIVHPRYPFIGCSPDRLCSDGAGLECKSPFSEAVHIGTWLDGMPGEHKAQVQGGMFVTGAPHWHFVSYDPRAAEPYRLYIEKIERDDAYIADLAGALRQLDTEVNLMVARIKAAAAEQQR